MNAVVGKPSECGVDPRSVLAFLNALDEDDRIEPHGLIIQRHGRRIAEGYWRPHNGGRSRLLYSLSKSFTGTALALQIGEGRLGLDDLVVKYLPERFEKAHPGLTGLRIRHIASMSTGHNRETFQEATAIDAADPVRGFLQIPPDAEPGTLFAYNQPPVITLATILQQLAGERLTDYLRPRLFDPLGIGDVRSAQLRPGLEPGFTGIYTNLDAVARLGQLYLDNGACAGEQLLPEDWVQQASSVQVNNAQNTEPDWRQGYGIQLWMSRHGYRGDGAYGQYMVVLPEHDAVIAMFSCTEYMQRVLDLMWTHLLPGMTNDVEKARSADAVLAERLATLELATPQARLGGRAPGHLQSGVLTKATDAKSHPSIEAVALKGDHIELREGAHTLLIPISSDWTPAPGDTIAASATQLADGDIVVDLVMLDTPHRLELTLHSGTGKFKAQWPVMPLFGAGLGGFIASMHAPGFL